MLSKKQMKSACKLSDDLFIYRGAMSDPCKLDEYYRLVDQSSVRQCREINMSDDPDEAFRLMEAADRGVRLPRRRVKVLTEAERVGMPEFCAVRTPGWRVHYLEQRKLLRAHTSMVH